jgi:hypothetical protein
MFACDEVLRSGFKNYYVGKGESAAPPRLGPLAGREFTRPLHRDAPSFFVNFLFGKFSIVIAANAQAVIRSTTFHRSAIHGRRKIERV